MNSLTTILLFKTQHRDGVIMRNQDVLHALVQPPSLLILQLGRFFTPTPSRGPADFSAHITIPTFTGHGGEVHIGKVVTAGHCPTFYFPDDNEDLLVV